MSDLTLLVPLKGRTQCTIRLLHHISRLKFPYKILLADGEVDGKVEKRIKLHPELDLEYIKYPDDETYRDYFGKMVDALSRVTTSYVMIVDNDNFPCFSGIEAGLKFLPKNPDYVCYAGRGAIVSFFPSGRICRFFETPDRDRKRPHNLTYYAIYRTPVLRSIWKSIAQINFSDMMLQELFVHFAALGYGKVHHDLVTITHVAQQGGSLYYPHQHNWVGHLLRSKFSTDVALMRELSSVDDEFFLDHFVWFLGTIYDPKQRRRPNFRRRFPRFTSYLHHCYYKLLGPKPTAELKEIEKSAMWSVANEKLS